MRLRESLGLGRRADQRGNFIILSNVCEGTNQVSSAWGHAVRSD